MCLNWNLADLEGEQASFFGQKVGNYCHSAFNGQTQFSMPKIARSCYWKNVTISGFPSSYKFKAFFEKIPLYYTPKPFMRKVRTSRRHLWAEKRAIHGTW